MAAPTSTTTLGSMSPNYMFGAKETPRFLTVTQAFYHHASKSPNSIAAKDLATSQTITYEALAKRSAQLAKRLQLLGVVPGARVPLVVKRGIDMLVGIVSILACGAQYVPLDGGIVPDSTLRFVIEQSGGQSCTVLTIGSTRHRVNEDSVQNVVCIDEDNQQHTTSGSPPPADLANQDGGCYVIYTSGTTGTPKGVDVTHRNVCNLLCLSPGDLGITTGTRVGQVLNVSFDMAAWEMLGCLCNGGTLILRGSDWRAALREVDVLIATPSILAKYNPEEFPNIRTVATAGEPSSQRLADTWASSGTYYNCCGPTETTIVNTIHRHQKYQPLTIGKPTPNNNVYILDDKLQPVSNGQPGVMWAGGRGVSKGYVGLPDRTAERYVADPFTRDGTMMYNTGDLGRWNDDGSIHILGRSDDQVKFKGFRVELDGVTTTLRSCSEVDEAVVLLIDDELHAFVTPSTCDIQKVKTHVQYSQPYYAVPSKIHTLPSLPLTPNGKIDKKALRESTTPIVEINSFMPEKPKTAIVAVRQSSSSTSSFTHVKTSSDVSSSSSFTIFDEKAGIDLEAAVPDKNWGKKRRGLRHRILIVYRQLFSIVGLLNILAALVLIFTGLQREWLGTLTAMNLLLAVLIRQEFVINTVYTVTCNVPKSFPLWVRTRCARIFHLGGVHSAAGVCAALWLLANNLGDAVCMGTGSCSGEWGQQSITGKVVSWLLTALFIVMLTMAYPTIRKKYHDHFERTHRFTGWTMLALFWVQVVLTANDTRPESVTLGEALLKTPPMWLLVVATLSIASSWFWLRKVPVEAEVLSDHAVRLHFDYTVPVNGSFTRLSRKPLVEWHSFATIPAPEPENGRPAGYSLVVSNAGDWTKKTIQDAPTHLWVRGVPTCGVMRIATLFRRIVVIGTGSGIGPLLGHIQNPSCPTQLIWSTKDPEKTFGPALVKSITDKIPGAVIHDTKKQGRPDLVKMGYNMVKGFGAEAVIIIANEKITKKVVYGLESRGVAAYGAIWDS